jgi:hypothetical protein
VPRTLGILLGVFYLIYIMKEKQLKIKVELGSLESVLAKLEEKYIQFPSKNLSDTITHLQATIRSLKNV